MMIVCIKAVNDHIWLFVLSKNDVLVIKHLKPVKAQVILIFHLHVIYYERKGKRPLLQHKLLWDLIFDIFSKCDTLSRRICTVSQIVTMIYDFWGKRKRVGPSYLACHAKHISEVNVRSISSIRIVFIRS
jgi:hypothetical protein